MRSEEEANRAIDRYADMVRRLCMVHLKNPADTEDIFQTVFLKYILSSAVFESPEHEKAWFIRVTLNALPERGQPTGFTMSMRSLNRFSRMALASTWSFCSINSQFLMVR